MKKWWIVAVLLAMLTGSLCAATAEDVEAVADEVTVELGGGDEGSKSEEKSEKGSKEVLKESEGDDTSDSGSCYIPYPDVYDASVRKQLKASRRVYPGVLLWPLPGHKPLSHITSHVGWRNAARIHGNQGGSWPSWLHHGIDVGGVTTSQPVVAAASGVAYAGVRRGYGLYVVIDHGNGWYTEYQHLSSFAGDVYRGCKGVKVRVGDPIGYVGNSGGDYPVHFHFEIAWSPNGAGATDKKYFKKTRNKTVRAYSFPQQSVVKLRWAKKWEICTAERQKFVRTVEEIPEDQR